MTGGSNKPKTDCAAEIQLEYRQNMASLFESGKHSDVSFVIGDAKFPAHKAILSARSVVFAAILEHEATKVAQERKVEIKDVPSRTFKELLQFLHTGKIPSKDEFTENLLMATEKVTCAGYRYESY